MTKKLLHHGTGDWSNEHQDFLTCGGALLIKVCYQHTTSLSFPSRNDEQCYLAALATRIAAIIGHTYDSTIIYKQSYTAHSDIRMVDDWHNINPTVIVQTTTSQS